MPTTDRIQERGLRGRRGRCSLGGRTEEAISEQARTEGGGWADLVEFVTEVYGVDVVAFEVGEHYYLTIDCQSVADMQ